MAFFSCLFCQLHKKFNELHGNRKLVEAKFRAGTVPLHPSPHHQAQGASETVPGAAPREGLLRGAQELQAGGSASIRAL